MTNIPYTRTFPYVLRDLLTKPAAAKVIVAEVAAVPDALSVTIDQNGVQTTIPRLSTYTPTVGEPVHVLVGETTMVAIGAVGGSPGGGGSGGHAILDEATLLPDRGQLAFVGAGVSAADDAANDKTVVTVPTPTPADATTSSKGIVQLAGDLAGTAASPQIAAGAVSDAEVAAANKDGSAATPSLRTLGSGAQQAAAGNDPRLGGYGTSLPASPINGQIFTLVDSTTNPSWQWTFRYNAGSSSGYKWEYVGGTPALAVVETAESTASTAFTDLATVGPQITLPRGGEFFIQSLASVQAVSGTVAYAQTAITQNNSFAVALGLLASNSPTSAAPNWDAAIFGRIGGTSAGDILKQRYAVGAGGGTVTFARRRLAITPFRVS